MAHVLIMPRQGNTVESCIIQEWKVQEGDLVKEDTAVCVVETDKASFEIPAGADGQILKLLYPAGEDVTVLAPIAVIGKAGEDWQGIISDDVSRKGAEAQREEEREKRKEKKEEKDSNISSSPLCASVPLCETETEKAVSPRAKKLAARKGISPEKVPGTGPGGRVIERDIKAALAGQPPLTAAALAAVSAGGTIPKEGTGLGGRITLNDLTADFSHTPTALCSLLPSPFSPLSSPSSITPVKGIRKIIAGRMLTAVTESAQFTLNASASAVRILELRKQLKNAKDNTAELNRITINDIILYAVSRVLPSYQYMNAHKVDDQIMSFNQVHLGIAVDTPRGLMVPVLKNANKLSLRAISAEAKRLAHACLNGTIKPEELTGSTFSISNLGSYGITSFTPILNLPEVAILGVCNIELKPIMQHQNESTQPPFDIGNPSFLINYEPHIGFSLTINHEAVDGAPAARFLEALCRAVADFNLLLASG